MAVNRTTQAALTIALSLFVMLTFALGVTSYLFFTKRDEAELAQKAAEAKAVEVQTKLQEIKAEMEKLRGVIGVAGDMPVADVETGLNDLFAGDFAGFKGDEKSYLKLIEWLRAEFRDKTTKSKTVEQEKRDLETKTAVELKAAKDDLEKARQAEAKARDDLEAKTADFETKWQGHEKKQRELEAEMRNVAETASEFDSLKSAVLSVVEFLKPASQEISKGKNPVERVEIIRDEIRSQAAELKRLNEKLSQARVATPAAQQAVANLRPKNDRIDGIDGRVVDVDPRAKTVLVSCRSTAGIRPGLVLHVFPPGEQRPQAGDRKAVIEVTEVEGSNRVRAVIRRENARDPIISGDGVASSLLGAGLSPAIMIVGFADVDNDGRPDLERLTALVSKAGGRVVDAVAADTALVVDLGVPKESAGGDKAPGWAAEEKRRNRAIDTAKSYGTRVGGIEVLLDMLGLEADSFEVGRLPRGREVGRFPPRR